jgi:hypothetical protein
MELTGSNSLRNTSYALAALSVGRIAADVKKNLGLVANIGRRLGSASRTLDLPQSDDPYIEFALVGRCPLKCVVPESFEHVLRATTSLIGRVDLTRTGAP